MVREDMENIPDFILPEDFNFTLYKDNSDADTWLDIQNQAAGSDCFGPDIFNTTYNNDTEALKERLIFICDKTGKKIVPTIPSATITFQRRLKAALLKSRQVM